MTPNSVLTQAGILPLRTPPVRFAIGPPHGLTSNAWRIWTTPAGDVYIACRDNFKETKVSLHTSGRWRMGYTQEAIKKNPKLLGNDEDRAWEVWDRPPKTLPDTIAAFRLIFLTPELAVRPEQRPPSSWKNVIYIEPAPHGKVVIATLFITRNNAVLRHATEPHFCLASFAVGERLCAQLIAHTDPEGNWPEIIDRHTKEARRQTESAGIKIPDAGYAYFFGHQEDGCRFIVGAKLIRDAA